LGDALFFFSDRIKPMMFTSKNLKNTEDFAESFLKNLKRNPKEATILALYGDLGSGKTTFTQFLAKNLGVKNYVTSPTFVLQKRYSCTTRPFKTLIHIDCYRLDGGSEMDHLGWKEIIHNADNLIVLEWPERIEEILPVDCIRLRFEFISENERMITQF
jgi:tRNA threonylcarbamoyladenosine biosynthesis protein TsaE